MNSMERKLIKAIIDADISKDAIVGIYKFRDFQTTIRAIEKHEDKAIVIVSIRGHDENSKPITQIREYRFKNIDIAPIIEDTIIWEVQ